MIRTAPLKSAQPLDYTYPLLVAQGDFAEAELLYKRSLTIRETVLGPDHPDVASSLNTWAVLLTKQARSGHVRKIMFVGCFPEPVSPVKCFEYGIVRAD